MNHLILIIQQSFLRPFYLLKTRCGILSFTRASHHCLEPFSPDRQSVELYFLAQSMAIWRGDFTVPVKYQASVWWEMGDDCLSVLRARGFPLLLSPQPLFGSDGPGGVHAHDPPVLGQLEGHTILLEPDYKSPLTFQTEQTGVVSQASSSIQTVPICSLPEIPARSLSIHRKRPYYSVSGMEERNYEKEKFVEPYTHYPKVLPVAIKMG